MVVKDFEYLVKSQIVIRARDHEEDTLRFFPFLVFFLTVLGLESVIRMHFYLFLDDVLNIRVRPSENGRKCSCGTHGSMGTGLLQRLYFDTGQGLNKLSIIDELIRRISILCSLSWSVLLKYWVKRSTPYRYRQWTWGVRFSIVCPGFRGSDRKVDQ